MTAALLPFYKTAGLLRRVDGVGSPKDVTERLLGVIGK
jgi:adenylate kinase